MAQSLVGGELIGDEPFEFALADNGFGGELHRGGRDLAGDGIGHAEHRAIDDGIV